MRIIIPTISFLIFGSLFLGFSINQASAELEANNAFILEGSGFAVTEKQIRNSEIDVALFTGLQLGSNINIAVEDGFVTLGQEDFIVTGISGNVLRDGRFLRLTGIAENNIGEEISISLFGRLVQDSESASVYGFTGRITQDENSYRLVYTTKISGITQLAPTPSEIISEEEEIIVQIMPGSSDPSLVGTYRGGAGARADLSAAQGDQALRLRYFSVDRLTIEPGTSVTFVNQDSVSHFVTSGTGLGPYSRALQSDFVVCDESQQLDLPEGYSFVRTADTASECQFTLDGRINSGEILPGQSFKATFSDAGFYRIIDPAYPWMNLVVYSFPDVGSIILGNQARPKQYGN